MASQHRIIKINDRNIKRIRKKKYIRVYKGDVLRISRATQRSTNDTIQRFGLNKNMKMSVNTNDLIVLEVRQGTNKILPPKQSSITFPNSDSGNEIIFPGVLTPEEKTLVDAFVLSQIASSNWDKINSFVHFGLSDPLNALWDWKRDISMTNNGATFDANGAVFDGTALINTNFSPLNDGISYQQDDAMIGVFQLDGLTAVDLSYVWGNGTFGGSSKDKISNDGVINRHRGSVNFLGESNLNGLANTDNALDLTVRIDATGIYAYKNGIQQGAQVSQASELPSANTISIGGNLNTPSYVGRISSFIAGGAVGFDQVNYYDNLVILNDSLAGIVP